MVSRNGITAKSGVTRRGGSSASDCADLPMFIGTPTGKAGFQSPNLDAILQQVRALVRALAQHGELHESDRDGNHRSLPTAARP